MGEMGAKDIAGKWVERLVGEMGEDARNGLREFPKSPELQRGVERGWREGCKWVRMRLSCKSIERVKCLREMVQETWIKLYTQMAKQDIAMKERNKGIKGLISLETIPLKYKLMALFKHREIQVRQQKKVTEKYCE